eukprot:PITA_08331
MEGSEPISETSLASELRNLFIKILLLQAIKEIPICTKIIKELCLKKPGRKRLESKTIQFVGRAAELMMGCVSMEKYIDPGNPVVSIHIGNVLVSNVLIDLGAVINVMMKQTMDQLRLSHLCLTPIVLELTDRSRIKPEGVLDNVIISLDSWEYPADFIVLWPKNPVGGHPLILGRPWLATANAYIGWSLCDEETQRISLIHQLTGSSQEDEIQDSLNNLDTMPNFELFSQIFSLDFQDNHVSYYFVPLHLTIPLSTPKLDTTLVEISPDKSLHISTDLNSSQQEKLVNLLQNYPSAFAWGYEDMKGVPPETCTHHIYI